MKTLAAFVAEALDNNRVKARISALSQRQMKETDPVRAGQQVKDRKNLKRTKYALNKGDNAEAREAYSEVSMSTKRMRT